MKANQEFILSNLGMSDNANPNRQNHNLSSQRAQSNIYFQGHGAGRFGAGTFGCRRLFEQNPWQRTAIKCKCYYRKALFHQLFHPSNFCFRQHHFHPENIYLLRISRIDPATISVKEGLFSSKPHTFRNNSLHPIQGWIQLPFHLDHDFFINSASTSTWSKQPAPKRPVPKSHVPTYTHSQTLIKILYHHDLCHYHHHHFQ